MNLLLDTHIWLWNDLQPEKISSQIALELASPSNELWLSPVSIWELALLLEKKRITIPMEFTYSGIGAIFGFTRSAFYLGSRSGTACVSHKYRTKIWRIDFLPPLPRFLT
jgi:hypothetical protein